MSSTHQIQLTPKTTCDLNTVLQQTADFRSQYPSNTAFEIGDKRLSQYADYRIADEWCRSAEGKQVLSDAAQEATKLLILRSKDGHPGHDVRHMLIKDPIAALRYAESDPLSGLAEAALIPSVFHDYGRLLESTFVKDSYADIKSRYHSAVGYAALAEVLSDYPEMPKALQNELLLAVAMHSSRKAQLPFITRVVQAADREQIIGDEGITRALMYDMGLGRMEFIEPAIDGAVPINIECNPKDLSFIESLEYFARYIQNPLEPFGNERFHTLRAHSALFIQMICSDEYFERIFENELAENFDRNDSVRALPKAAWEQVMAGLSPSLQALNEMYHQYDFSHVVSCVINPGYAEKSGNSFFLDPYRRGEKLSMMPYWKNFLPFQMKLENVCIKDLVIF